MWWESLRRWIVIRRTIPSRPCLSKKLESLEHVGYKSISQIFALSSHNKIYCSCFRFLIVAVVVVEAAWWGLTESLGHRVSERVFIIIFIFVSIFPLSKCEELMAAEEVNKPPTLPPYPQVHDNPSQLKGKKFNSCKKF